MSQISQEQVLIRILLGNLGQELPPVRAVILSINFAMKDKISVELEDLFLFFPLPQITLGTKVAMQQRMLLMISQISGLGPFTELHYLEYNQWLHSCHSL